MTPTFCCGMECGVLGVTFNTVGLHWHAASGAPTFSTAIVRSGARSLRCTTTGSSVTATTLNLTAGDQVARIFIRFESFPTTTSDGFVTVCNSLGTAGGTFASLRYQISDGKLYPGTNTTTGVSVTTGIWYLIEQLYDTTADTCTWRVNGTNLTAQTGCTGNANTFVVGSSTITGGTSDFYYDDLLMSSTVADFPLGPGFVNHFVPTADGAHNVAGANDFERGATGGVDILNSTTDSYLLIDDVPMIADDTAIASLSDDFINAIAPAAGTDYTEHVYGPASGISTPTVAPRAVEAVVQTAQAATATGSFKLNLNDNGTLDTIKEQVTVAGIALVKTFRKHYTTPPTGGAWTVVSGAGNFNNLRVRFYSADAAPDQYFVATMIEAEFAEVVADADTRWMNALPSYHHLSHTNVSY